MISANLEQNNVMDVVSGQYGQPMVSSPLEDPTMLIIAIGKSLSPSSRPESWPGNVLSDDFRPVPYRSGVSILIPLDKITI
jgi:hypothetical protein